jgi:hypothetical protein
MQNVVGKIGSGELRLGKKPKRKAKGKKLYKNTHGTWYRVRLGYRLRRKIKHRKTTTVTG